MKQDFLILVQKYQKTKNVAKKPQIKYFVILAKK